MNPLLQKTEQAIMAKVNPPQLKPVVQKIVDAGKKIMYSDGTRDMLAQQLAQPGDQAENVGAGIAKLMGILFNQSKGTLPMPAAIPAATILLCEGLQLLEDAGRIQVDNESLAEYMKAMTSNLLQLFGATPEKLGEFFGGAAPGGQQAPAAPAAQQSGIINGAMGGA